MKRHQMNKDFSGKLIFREFIAGLTTYLTMSYIVFVNPDILAQSGMNHAALIAVTCLVTAIASIGCGIFTGTPIAMSPGMGLNAFFTYTLVIGEGVSWQTALGVVFISGLSFFILSVLGIRKMFIEAIPKELLRAISVGIGLFIAFIGLQKLGLVIANPVTFVQAASMDANIMTGLAGLLVMLILKRYNKCYALITGIAVATIIAVLRKDVMLPEKIVSHNFNISEIAFKLDLFSALKISLVSHIFTLMFIDMFDSLGTIAGIFDVHPVAAGKKKNPVNRLLLADSVSTMIGAVLGTSTTTAYLESAAGVEEGGRTGLTAVFTGILFFLTAFFVPLIAIVPGYAVAPALILVGMSMVTGIKEIDFKKVEQAFPAFVTFVMIALSYSISTGLAFGFVSFTLLHAVSGKISRIKPLMWIISGLSVVYLMLH